MSDTARSLLEEASEALDIAQGLLEKSSHHARILNAYKRIRAYLATAEQAKPVADKDALISDLALLLRRCTHFMKRELGSQPLATIAMDFLTRNGLQGSPLREGVHEAVNAAPQPQAAPQEPGAYLIRWQSGGEDVSFDTCHTDDGVSLPLYLTAPIAQTADASLQQLMERAAEYCDGIGQFHGPTLALRLRAAIAAIQREKDSK